MERKVSNLSKKREEEKKGGNCRWSSEQLNMGGGGSGAGSDGDVGRLDVLRSLYSINFAHCHDSVDAALHWTPSF
jgi:hypothetical protein